MPRVKVKYLNVHYSLTRMKEEFIEFQGALTLRELLNEVTRRYKSVFRDSILDGENRLKPHVWILINQEVIRELETTLKDGDVVVFSLPIAGG